MRVEQESRRRQGPAAVTLLALGLSSFAWTSAAKGEPPKRVVLTHEDAEFREGLELLLSSAGVEVVVAPDQQVSATLDLLELSRDLASREEAVAVVWLVPQGAGTKLVVISRDGDRVLSRVLASTPPLSEEQAAEAVLAARTMFHAFDVLPGAEAAAPTAATPPPPRDVTESPVPAVEPPTVTASVSRASGRILVQAGAAVRVSAVTAPSLGVGAAWRRGRLALWLWGDVAVAKDLSGPRFAGTWHEVDLAALVRVDALRRARLRLEVGAGAGAHRVRLQGRLPANGDQPVDETSWDPTLRLDVAAYVRVTGRVELGLLFAGDLLLRRQDFLVGSEEVVGMPPFAGGAGLQVRVLFL